MSLEQAMQGRAVGNGTIAEQPEEAAEGEEEEEGTESATSFGELGQAKEGVNARWRWCACRVHTLYVFGKGHPGRVPHAKAPPCGDAP